MSKVSSEHERIYQLCRSVVNLHPANPDPLIVYTIVGDYAFRTLPEISRAFGVSLHTVKGGWRAGGLPGETGCYPAAGVVLWLIDRNHLNERYGHRPEKYEAKG